MRQPRDTAAVPPPGYWRYVNSEDGWTLKNANYDNLKREVKQYRRANNYPIGLNFTEEFDDNLCAHAVSQTTCADYIPPTILEKASHLAQALYRWGRSGFKTRSPEDCERVIGVCRACPDYSGESGIMQVACRRCGCSRLKAYLSTESCPIGKW